MLARLRKYFQKQKQLCRAVDRKMKTAPALNNYIKVDHFLKTKP